MDCIQWDNFNYLNVWPIENILLVGSNLKGVKIMKAYVNEECILCGICADMCPEIFELGDERAEVLLEEIPMEHEECCREAADDCSTDAIEIND